MFVTFFLFFYRKTNNFVFMESINEKIKLLRKQRGISQVEVAKTAGINQASYSNIEKGDTKSITIEVGKGIARALGISFAELFDIEPSKDNSEQIEKLKVENISLKKQLEEKVFLIETLKDEKAHIKMSFLVKLFSEYSREIVFIGNETKVIEDEKEKDTRLKKFQANIKFNLEMNYYIQMGFLTQLDFLNHALHMRDFYDFIPEEFEK